MSEAKGQEVLTKFGKILPKQLPPDKDMIESLKKACRDNGIQCAAILSTVGSLQKLTIEGITPADTRAGKEAGLMQEIAGPLQVLSLEGVIFESENGKMDQHIHGMFVDESGRLCGGHLIEGRNPVRTRFFSIIGELVDVRIFEQYEDKSGHWLMHVERS